MDAIDLALLGIKKVKDRLDLKKVCDFLRSDRRYTYRTTAAIAKGTVLSVERVREVVSLFPKYIRRNVRERESWTLTETDAR